MNTTPLPSETEMYRAMRERDTTYDGIFFTGVKTTGIFCRPGCPAKTPKRENVRFYAAAKDAFSRSPFPNRMADSASQNRAMVSESVRPQTSASSALR